MSVGFQQQAEYQVRIEQKIDMLRENAAAIVTKEDLTLPREKDIRCILLYVIFGLYHLYKHHMASRQTLYVRDVILTPQLTPYHVK